jgi:hypothetical protein
MQNNSNHQGHPLKNLSFLSLTFMLQKFSRALNSKLNSQVIHKSQETEQLLKDLEAATLISSEIMNSIANDITLQLNLNASELNVYNQIKAILIHNCNPELAIKQIGADENYKGLMLLYFDIFLENKTITQTLLISNILQHICALHKDNNSICMHRTGDTFLEDMRQLQELAGAIHNYVEQQCAEELESSNAIMISSMMLEYKSAFLSSKVA